MGNSSFSCTYSKRSGHNYRSAPEWLVVLSTNCRFSTPSMLHLPTTTSTRSSPANHVVITSSSSTGRSSEASPDVECIHLQCRTGTDAFSLARLGAIHVTRRDIYSERLECVQALASQALDRKDEEKLSLQHSYFEQDSLTITH
ncbi:hypothetical protein ASPSYDRAFT_1162966 [Aspergillus sydowii CBS 593.65]|uniref:Uncharacterized protein n=1 Tax=Aspergillus sydowii CBS 593.65 TaxID=1036612 RepID=A0A1L9T2T2_9EURO|nr:uncharacterized protein ASPSYDRAFT_1162966 [Aspergillus sydowii CBS 593.65]OJJ53728.1 hypothetical protein ASPSYDRAFT_1162966 [Aspergillus sydowii CBS 593.65]